MERIKTITTKEDRFDEPEDFDPDDMLEGAFGLIFDEPTCYRIWFSADKSRYFEERRWSANQEITHREDGSIELAMSTSGKFEVKRWIFSFGPEAELLEPESLRHEIRSEMAMVLSKYEGYRI